MPTAHVADELLEAYRAGGRRELEEIVSRSPTVADTLAEASKRLSKVFGARTLRLAIRPDPDSPGYAPIVVSIPASNNIADDLAKLERFDREWWLDASMREPAEICILVEPE
jgi:hypothetical protein